MVDRLRSKNLLAGLLLAAIGLTFAIASQAYEFGTARSMGPGYLPMLLGILLMVIGLGLAAVAFVKPGEPATGFSFRGLFCITGGVVLFALLVRDVGLFLAILLLAMMASLANPKFNLLKSITVGVVLAAGCSVIFVRLLGMPLPVFGNWFPF